MGSGDSIRGSACQRQGFLSPRWLMGGGLIEGGLIKGGADILSAVRRPLVVPLPTTDSIRHFKNLKQSRLKYSSQTNNGWALQRLQSIIRLAFTLPLILVSIVYSPIAQSPLERPRPVDSLHNGACVPPGRWRSEGTERLQKKKSDVEKRPAQPQGSRIINSLTDYREQASSWPLVRADAENSAIPVSTLSIEVQTSTGVTSREIVTLAVILSTPTRAPPDEIQANQFQDL